jgi:hypothetical protein
VIVRGTLAMKPASASIVHRLAFVNVNEATYIGGGLEPVPADVGLWVRDGQLDLEGTPKTAWTRLAGSVSASATTMALEAAPAGWAVGDEISLVPTEPPSVNDPSWSGFDRSATTLSTKPTGGIRATRVTTPSTTTASPPSCSRT